jgi:hypothetical protein
MLAAHEIFAFMSPALALEIVERAHATDRDAYRTLLGTVAEFRHVRPVFLERKPRAECHRAIAESLCKPKLELQAVTLLQTWLLKTQSAMLMDFLNALEIKHENGVVDSLPETVDDAKLNAAVEALLAKHPREHVAVYLRAFNDLNRANWKSLATLLDSDARLQLGG